jgi:endonuclease/exonuclease/phosphatase (EEP) superfamily protein YafD
MKTRIFGFLQRYAVALVWVYFTILFGWLVLYLLFGDRFGYLGLVNNFAVYLFFPLPIIAIVAFITRRKELIGGTLLGAAVFLWFWGALFMPRLSVPQRGNPHPPLTVMTYNILGSHGFSDPVIDVIRNENADIVLLQELTPDLARAMQTELIEVYPYQIMDPRPGVSGAGTLSRYPMQDTGETFPLKWVGDPQILVVDFEGTFITLVNFHTFAYTYSSSEAVTANLRGREALAEVLADFVAKTPGPLIAAGDANAVNLSETYRIITSSGLTDAWYEAGFGLGGTFPGSTVPASSRWKIGSWYVPQWMLRIDYVFVSLHWGVSSARMAQFDGVSDHRGIVAELVLK